MEFLLSLLPAFDLRVALSAGALLVGFINLYSQRRQYRESLKGTHQRLLAQLDRKLLNKIWNDWTQIHAGRERFSITKLAEDLASLLDLADSLESLVLRRMKSRRAQATIASAGAAGAIGLDWAVGPHLSGLPAFELADIAIFAGSLLVGLFQLRQPALAEYERRFLDASRRVFEFFYEEKVVPLLKEFPDIYEKTIGSVQRLPGFGPAEVSQANTM